MRKLVRQELFQLRVVAIEGHHHAVAQALGKATHPLSEKRINDICGLKL